MTNESAMVSEYLAVLDHPMADTVRQLRAGILRLDPAVTELIKWNAPNFQFHGQDRVTFQLRRPDRIVIVLHRGVKPTSPDGFQFADPSGRITWAAPDRGIITIGAPETDPATSAEVLQTIRAWLLATA